MFAYTFTNILNSNTLAPKYAYKNMCFLINALPLQKNLNNF